MAALYHRPGPRDDWRDRRGDGPRMGDGPRGGPPPFRPMPPPVAPPAPEPEIDRETTCPLLLRVFPKLGSHHRLEEYIDRKNLPKEIAIYTWMDADLKELTELIKDVQPSARKPNARIGFAFVYPDKKGRNVMRQVGIVHATRPGEDDHKSLRQLNFQTGDYLDVAIY